MSELRLDTAARKLLDLRADHKKKDQAAKAAKSELDEHQRVVFDLMRGMGLETTTLNLGEGYGRVQIGRRETIRSRVIDLDAALDAFESEARVDEITKTEVRKAQLNELVRERLETGQPLPEGVDFTRTPFIQVTRRDK